MTVVEVDLRRPAQDGTDVAAKGSLECSPTVRRNVDEHIVLPDSFRAKLVDGKVTLNLAPTVDGTWAWEIIERTQDGAERLVSVADSVTPLNYADLPDVDPDTLDPAAPLTPAWQAYLDGRILALIANAPGALDTLNELAAALGDDPNFATTVTNLISLKADQSDLDALSTSAAAAVGAEAAARADADALLQPIATLDAAITSLLVAENVAVINTSPAGDITITAIGA